jgi:tetratricopeptide (TPR) repeat protein
MLQKLRSGFFIGCLVTGSVLLCVASGVFARSPAYNQGDAAYDRGDYQTAVSKFRQATMDDPNDANAYWRLGLSFRKVGNYSMAVQSWDRAKNIDPTLGFASSPSKFSDLYAKTLQAAQQKGAAHPAPMPRTITPPQPTTNYSNQSPNTGTQQRSSGSGMYVLIIAVVGGAAAFFWFRRSSEKDHIQKLNRDISHRLTELQDEFKRFDLEAATAKDSPLLQEAKQLRSAAVDPFALAGEAFNNAATVNQYLEADQRTTEAEKLAARARVRLDQALGRRTLDDPAGGAASIPSASQVPEDDRGACFFCSKPARLEDLRPLQINIEGRPQRVLACEDCYAVAKTGRQPQLLTVPDDRGQRVPWYQSNRYDPWNDYGRGGGIFGGGGGFGLMDYLLLENLFDHDRRSNTTIIYPQDSGYAERYARDAGGAGFGDSTWLQPERGERDFFGSGFETGGTVGAASGDTLGGDNS